MQKKIETTLKIHQLTPRIILNTHHHADHIGGNKYLKERYPNLQIYGSEYDKNRIPGITHQLNDQCTELNLFGLHIKVFFAKGHTQGHVLYMINDHDLFCGDVLFGGGCGKLFEGTFTDGYNSMKIFSSLPDSLNIFCAHEYTQKNLEIALKFDPTNEKIKNRLQTLSIPSVPFTLSREKETNPFLRTKELMVSLKVKSELEAFTLARQFRDKF